MTKDAERIEAGKIEIQTGKIETGSDGLGG
jgi:hypothetical protein